MTYIQEVLPGGNPPGRTSSRKEKPTKTNQTKNKNELQVTQHEENKLLGTLALWGRAHHNNCPAQLPRTIAQGNCPRYDRPPLALPDV